MKNSEFQEIRLMKSFRAKIIIYSLLSLLYTIITELAAFTLIKTLVKVSKTMSGTKKPDKEIFSALGNSFPLEDGGVIRGQIGRASGRERVLAGV